MTDKNELDNNNIENLNSDNSLITACEYNNESDVKALVNRSNESINQEDKNGNTPLIIAIKNDNDKIIKYLIKNGAEIRKHNNAGETPFTILCNNRKESIIKFIYENCIYDNEFIIMLLTYYQNRLPLSEMDLNTMLLLEKNKFKEIVNTKNKNGNTPLTLTIDNHCESIINYLIKFVINL